MEIENLNINGIMVPHRIVSIIGDGACLFASLAYLMYGCQFIAREVREQIVSYVVDNWVDFQPITDGCKGNNYTSSTEYLTDMSRGGSFCELVAAGQFFEFVFEVYRDGVLYVRKGIEGRPVKRLRITNDLSSGHFDAYIPEEDEDVSSQKPVIDAIKYHQKAPVKSRRRCTFVKRLKHLKDPRRKYDLRNPVAKKKKELNRAAVKKYKKNHHVVISGIEAKYEESHIGRRVEARVIAWKIKAHSGMEYDPDQAYEVDSTVALGDMSHTNATTAKLSSGKRRLPDCAAALERYSFRHSNLYQKLSTV